MDRSHQSSLSYIKKVTFFSNNHLCQSTKLLKPDSSSDEFGDYLLIVNSLINYID